MISKAKWVILNLSVLSFTSAHSNAMNTPPQDERFTVNGSLGYLAGKSQEFVYDSQTGRKISQLNWKINGAAVIKGEVNYKLRPWLNVNAQGWITLANGNAVMDDYDWLNPFQKHWTDWSHHNDTDLRQGNEYDLSLQARFFQQSTLQLKALLGYQRTLFSFLAKGGCYNYHSGMAIGCFPDDEIGIGYKQTFSTPYIGVAGSYLINSLEFNGIFKFSNLVTGNDVDQHYQRELTFKEGNDHFNFYNLVVNAGYYLKPQIKLFAEGSFNYIPTKKTSTTIRNNSTQVVTYENYGSAGLNNKYMLLSLGVQYKSMT